MNDVLVSCLGVDDFFFAIFERAATVFELDVSRSVTQADHGELWFRGGITRHLILSAAERLQWIDTQRLSHA